MRALFADRLLACQRGTAALEFALVLPVMVTLTLGLAGSVRRSLAEIDADAAANAAALVALQTGFVPDRIAAAARAADPDVQIDAIRFLDCGSKHRACAGLPPGRYVRIVASRQAASLFQPLAPARYQSTALVRLAAGK